MTFARMKALGRRLSALAGGVLALALACQVGCAPATDSPQSLGKRFVFITNGDSSFWDAAEKGWDETCRSKGMIGQFTRNKSGDAIGQIQILENVAATSDIGGVAISVVDAGATGLIDRLQEIAGRVPVITVDSDCKPEHADIRRAYVGTNNKEAGRVAGRIAKMLQPAGGSWIGFVGTEDADNARARIEGFVEGAGKGFKRLDVLQDLHDQTKARENVRAAITKPANLLFGIYSYNAPALAEVVADAGQRNKFKIVTFDAEENTLKAIETGQIDATIVQNTFDMGVQCANLLHAYDEGDVNTIKSLLGDGKELDTKVRVIVPPDSPLDDPAVQKIEEFKQFMKSKGLKST
jgi:ribose transport system substrate-binding protein